MIKRLRQLQIALSLLLILALLPAPVFAFIGPTPTPPPVTTQPPPEPQPDPTVAAVQKSYDSVLEATKRTEAGKALSTEDYAIVQQATRDIIEALAKPMFDQDKKEIVDDALSLFVLYDRMHFATQRDILVTWTNALAVAVAQANSTLNNLEWITAVAERAAKEIKPLADRLPTSDKRLAKTVAGLIDYSFKAVSTGRITSSMIENNINVFQIDRPRANDRLSLVRAFEPRFQSALSGFFNGRSIYKLNRQLNFRIDISKDRQGIRVAILPDVARELMDNNFESLSIDVNGFTTALPVDLIDDGKEAVLRVSLAESDAADSGELQPSLTLPKEGNQAIIAYDKGVVMSVDLALAGFVQRNLTSPLTLGMPYQAFSFRGTTNVNQVSVYRYYENLKGWRPVGGIYDPIANTFFAQRDNLSEYTLLKSTKTFSDVGNSSAKAAINKLLNKGTVPSAPTFKPTTGMTRGEFAQWVVKSYGLENTQGKTIAFTDVTKTNPYYSAIAITFHLDIMDPRTAKTFEPQKPLTKIEMAKALSVCLQKYQEKKVDAQLAKKLMSTTQGLSSAEAGNVSLLYELGVFSSGDLKNWDATITKEQAAAFFSKSY